MSARPASLAASVCVIAVCHVVAPEPAARTALLWLLVVPIAYGHLIGAVLPSSRRPGAADGAGLRAAFVWTTVACCFALFTELARALVAPLAAVSVWHVVENDVAMARGRAAALRLAPLARDARSHGASAAILAAATVAASGTPTGAAMLGVGQPWAAASGIDLDDLIALALLHHSFVWLLRLRQHSRVLRGAGEARRARRVARRVAAVHLAPLALSIAAAQQPGHALAGAWLTVTSPAVFFFFSVVHVVQTTWSRRREPPGLGPRLGPSHQPSASSR